jgi:hypothetical protein
MPPPQLGFTTYPMLDCDLFEAITRLADIG